MEQLKVTEQVLENAQIVISVYQQGHAMFAGSSQEHMKDVLVHLPLQSVMLILQLLWLMTLQWKKKEYARDVQNQVRV